MKSARQLQVLYQQGVNITQLIREESGADQNTSSSIDIAYDLQAGSYIEVLKNPEKLRVKNESTEVVAETIHKHCEPGTILEAGIGEGTSLAPLIKKLNLPGLRAFGFDLSWSRVAYAKRYLAGEGFPDVQLCTGDLFSMPYADNSIDLVITRHAVEPNGGREKEILRELYRVTRSILLMVEPDYEFASEEGKRRMEAMGYVRDLPGKAEELGYEVLDHCPFTHAVNPLNPSAVTVIRKETDAPEPPSILACPIWKTPLLEGSTFLFSPEALAAYPIIAGIPCLRPENAIVTSKIEEFEKLVLM